MSYIRHLNSLSCDDARNPSTNLEPLAINNGLSISKPEDGGRCSRVAAGVGCARALTVECEGRQMLHCLLREDCVERYVLCERVSFVNKRVRIA